MSYKTGYLIEFDKVNEYGEVFKSGCFKTNTMDKIDELKELLDYSRMKINFVDQIAEIPLKQSRFKSACEMPVSKIPPACVPEMKGMTYMECMEKMKTMEYKPYVDSIRNFPTSKLGVFMQKSGRQPRYEPDYSGDKLIGFSLVPGYPDSISIEADKKGLYGKVVGYDEANHLLDAQRYLIHSGGMGSGKTYLQSLLRAENPEDCKKMLYGTLDEDRIESLPDGSKGFVREHLFSERSRLGMFQKGRDALFMATTNDENDLRKEFQIELGKYGWRDLPPVISEGFFTWNLGKSTYDWLTIINNHNKTKTTKMKKQVKLEDVILTEEEKTKIADDLRLDSDAQYVAENMMHNFRGRGFEEKKRVLKMLILAVDADYQREKDEVAKSIAKLEDVLVEKNSKTSAASEFLK